MTKDEYNLKYDILKVSGMASEAKANDKKVINATVGVLYNEEGSIWYNKVIDKAFRDLEVNDIYNYSPLGGSENFKEVIKNWVFDKYSDEIKHLNPEIIATPGGTGALISALNIHLSPNETLLLPNLYWSPYSGMANCMEVKVDEYNYLKDNRFDLLSFIEHSKLILNNQHKLVTILNDPCNNPTGYSLTDKEIDGLIDFINTITDPVTLILDIAYYDYFQNGFKDVRKRLLKYLNVNKNVTIMLAQSCSKTFSVYGLRLGSLIILNHDAKYTLNMYQNACVYARTHWSNVTRPAMQTIARVLGDESSRTLFLKELEIIRETVGKRADLFMKESKEVNLDVLPSQGGFFVSIVCNDTYDAFEKLIQNGIYVIPFNHVLRLAICGLPLHEIKGLAKRIKTII